MGLKRSKAASERSTLSYLASGLEKMGEGVAELLWPTRCVLCDVPGTLLCDKCRLELPYIDPLLTCPHCGQAHGRLVCVDCNSFIAEHRGPQAGRQSAFDRVQDVSVSRDRDVSRTQGRLVERSVSRNLNVSRREDVVQNGGVSRKGSVSQSQQEEQVGFELFDRISSVFAFTDPSSKLITTFKDRKEIRLAGVLASLLADYIDPRWVMPGRTAIVAIPARKQAIRERGFDHMQQVGDRLAQLTGLPLLDMIVPNEQGDQRGLSALSRKENMRNSFLPNPSLSVGGFICRAPQISEYSYVILIDDVLTTGATLMSAALVLKQMGVQKIFALTVARLP